MPGGKHGQMIHYNDSLKENALGNLLEAIIRGKTLCPSPHSRTPPGLRRHLLLMCCAADLLPQVNVFLVQCG